MSQSRPALAGVKQTSAGLPVVTKLIHVGGGTRGLRFRLFFFSREFRGRFIRAVCNTGRNAGATACAEHRESRNRQ